MAELSPAAQAVLDAAKAKYELESDNFYKWIESCPLINHRISMSNKKIVICEFRFSSPPPHHVARDLERTND